MGNLAGRHLATAALSLAVGAIGVAWMRWQEREEEPMLVSLLWHEDVGLLYGPLVAAPLRKEFANEGSLRDIDSATLHAIGAERSGGSAATTVSCRQLPAALCLQYFHDDRALLPANDTANALNRCVLHFSERLMASPLVFVSGVSNSAATIAGGNSGESSGETAFSRPPLLCSFVACSIEEVERWHTQEGNILADTDSSTNEDIGANGAKGNSSPRRRWHFEGSGNTSTAAEGDQNRELLLPLALVPLRTFDEPTQQKARGESTSARAATLFGPLGLRFLPALEAVLECSVLVATAAHMAVAASPVTASEGDVADTVEDTATAAASSDRTVGKAAEPQRFGPFCVLYPQLRDFTETDAAKRLSNDVLHVVFFVFRH